MPDFDLILKVNKARPLHNTDVVPNVRIEICREISTDDVTLDELREKYRAQATRLSDALFSCLPGGMLDELLIEIMRRKASLFVVPHVGGCNHVKDFKAFNEAISFAITDDEPRAFLTAWREGNWDTIREEWPAFNLGTAIL